MIKNIYVFELKNGLKSVSFYIFALTFFIITFLFVTNTNPNVGIVMPVGKEWHNAPLVVARYFAFMSVYGILITIIFVGRTVNKDFKANIHDFFFTIPINKFSYLGGRFLAGLTVNILIYLSIIAGFICGCLVIDPQYYGPFSVSSFLSPFLFVLVPNLFFIACVFFCLATLSRKMVMTYLSGIGLLIFYVFFSIGLSYLKNDAIRILADPFAISSLSVITEYWTVADINTNSMPLTGFLILNRIIWFVLALSTGVFTLYKFRFSSMLESRKEIKHKALKQNLLAAINHQRVPSRTEIDHSFLNNSKKCMHLVWIEFRRITSNPVFIIITLLAMLNLAANFYGNVGPFANNLYPLTSWFLEQTDYLWVYSIPLIVIFSGIIIWRERDSQSYQIYDSLPLPNWVVYLGKLFALKFILVFYVSMIMIAGILTQLLIFGWTDLEPGLYIKYLFGIILVNYCYMAILFILIQNMVNNKYTGFFLCTVYFIIDILIFLVFAFDNILLRYGHIPDIIYSNLNEFGHYGQIIFWYSMYWLFFAIILVIITSLLWKRGEQTNFRHRIRSALAALNRTYKIALGVFALLFLMTGTAIYYNKYILNQHLSHNEMLEIQANYEKKYSKYQHQPQPKIKHIDLQVDLYPRKRDAYIKGYYTLRNHTDSRIDTIFVNICNLKISRINRIGLSRPAQLVYRGEENGFRIYELKNGLLPGQKINLRFDLQACTIGFTENNPKHELLDNGTCLVFTPFRSGSYFPVIGYDAGFEIEQGYQRKKLGLSKCPPLPALEDAGDNKSSFITFNAIISTDTQQTAIASGNLLKTWKLDNRKYFHYKAGFPMYSDFAIVSGQYKLATDQHDDIDIEIYYHEKHPWNIGRIIKGMKKGLDYCINNFSEYPFSTLRLAEVPNYFQFGAGGLPSLIIWNERAGFISNVEDPEAVDQLFGITTHEVAHNWWPGMILSANAEGSLLLDETIAQHVRTMCLKNEYEPSMLRNHLKKEMDDYLRLRSRDLTGERPLFRSYFNYYTTYAKSSLVMYALQDYIGEDKVNRALQNIYIKNCYQDDSNITSIDFINEIRAVTPDSFQYIVNDLFENIVLYENKALTASYEKLDSNRYRINLSVQSKKFQADSIGNQIEIALNDYIDIAVLGEGGEELYIKKHKLSSPFSQFELTVDKKPVKAGIDPYLVLIDRNRQNNLIPVTSQK